MTDSNKGWHSEWFYVSNPPPSLPRFSGHFLQKVDEWERATGKDEKKAWIRPMLAELGQLKKAGLTGVKVLWTFFERRVQPLKARAHPLYRYTGNGNPTRSSRDVLAPVEVRARVWAAIKRAKDVEDDVAELDRHEAGLAPEPAARREGLDPPVLLRARLCYPPLPEHGGLRATNQAENEHQRALSLQKKKLTAEKAKRHMLRQQGLLLEDPPRRAAPIAAAGISGSTTTAAAGSAVAAEEGVAAGRVEVAVSKAMPRSMTGPQVEEISPSVAATGEAAVLDLTGEASKDEEGLAAMLEAETDEEEVDTDPGRSDAPLDEAVPESGVRSAPSEEAPTSATTAPAVAPAATGTEASEALAWATAAVGPPALPSSGAETQGETGVAAEVPGRSVPPAASLSKQLAAEVIESGSAPPGELLVPASPGRADAPATGGALVPVRWGAPASERGKEPAPQGALPEAASGSSLDHGIGVVASGSSDELIWRDSQTERTLLRLEIRWEAEERAEMEGLVEQVSAAFTALVERSRRSSERNADKLAFLRDIVRPYVRQAESMREHHQSAERRMVEAEADIESLRRGLAGAQDKMSSLRAVVRRLGEVEAELTQAQETRESALARRDELCRELIAANNQRVVALRERDDAVSRATAVEVEAAAARSEHDEARQEAAGLHWDLGQEHNKDRARELREDLELARVDSMECVAALQEELGRTRADFAAQEAELGELSRAAAAVALFTFGAASASGSSVVSRLAGVPGVVRRSITKGIRLGGYLALMSAGGLYENLNLEAISRGVPSVRTAEEMAALGRAARASANAIVSRVPTDAVLEAARNSEPHPEDGGEGQGADGGDAP
ncbi:hypothetical protein BAE44_0025620 [Dichanthelium oligosanthes]|uniref:Uncharacterized protein n=1 Tax=Dichanthelium oligosanthes TaxID=888268 RepID=A0A1E5UKH3_9POAL|nr:hypothetical protein BAE44_0025620 [Dichanthelium oligosanthes]